MVSLSEYFPSSRSCRTSTVRHIPFHIKPDRPSAVVADTRFDSTLTLRLWYNGVPALQFPATVLRTTNGIQTVTGMFFSTFFGGDDNSWATPTQQYIYFKNIAMYGGNGQSTATGSAAPTGAVATSGSTGAAVRGAVPAGVAGWGAVVLGGLVGVTGLVVGASTVGA